MPAANGLLAQVLPGRQIVFHLTCEANDTLATRRGRSMQTQFWFIAGPTYWLIALAVAPFAGSFLGVLIRRLPEGRPIAFARSSCDTCGATLSVPELVPLASYVRQGGRCRRCGEAIGSFHPAIELAATGVAAWVILADTDPTRLWVDCLLGWVLLALSWIDWQCMRLPDALTLPLLLVWAAVHAGNASRNHVQPRSRRSSRLSGTPWRRLVLSYRSRARRDRCRRRQAARRRGRMAWPRNGCRLLCCSQHCLGSPWRQRLHCQAARCGSTQPCRSDHVWRSRSGFCGYMAVG